MLLTFLDLGSAYGTAKAGVGVAHLGVMNPGRLMKGIIPCVMAGILGIYGLIVAAIIANLSMYFLQIFLHLSSLCQERLLLL